MKNLIFILCLSVCFAACNSDSPVPDPVVTKPRADIPLTQNEKQLTVAGNSFAYDLYTKVRAIKTTPNVVLSPLSVSLAFSMVNNGAAGTTREEIQKVLGFEGYGAADINSYYKKMMEAATTVDPQVTLETANSIWTNNGFPVLPEFVNVNREAFDAEVRNEDFSLPSTLKMINDWASEKTHGKIPTILEELDPETVVLLMNALYFLGDWSDAFDEGNTADAPFTNANGQNTKVKMMKKMVNETSYCENEQFATINLPYGNGAFYMQLILPHKNVPLEEVTKDLQKNLNWKTSDLEMVHANVSLELPRFEIDFEIGLNDVLKGLGMNAAFDPYTADFSAMSDIPTFISFVKQKASITVNEKGSEAAAVTVVGMLTTSVPPTPVARDFHVDRPYLFLIKEVSTDAIFFMGEITEL
jgi:serpin B